MAQYTYNNSNASINFSKSNTSINLNGANDAFYLNATNDVVYIQGNNDTVYVNGAGGTGTNGANGTNGSTNAVNFSKDNLTATIGGTSTGFSINFNGNNSTLTVNNAASSTNITGGDSICVTGKNSNLILANSGNTVYVDSSVKIAPGSLASSGTVIYDKVGGNTINFAASSSTDLNDRKSAIVKASSKSSTATTINLASPIGSTNYVCISSDGVSGDTGYAVVTGLHGTSTNSTFNGGLSGDAWVDVLGNTNVTFTNQAGATGVAGLIYVYNTNNYLNLKNAAGDIVTLANDGASATINSSSYAATININGANTTLTLNNAGDTVNLQNSGSGVAITAGSQAAIINVNGANTTLTLNNTGNTVNIFSGGSASIVGVKGNNAISLQDDQASITLVNGNDNTITAKGAQSLITLNGGSGNVLNLNNGQVIMQSGATCDHIFGNGNLITGAGYVDITGDNNIVTINSSTAFAQIYLYGNGNNINGNYYAGQQVLTYKNGVLQTGIGSVSDYKNNKVDLLNAIELANYNSYQASATTANSALQAEYAKISSATASSSAYTAFINQFWSNSSASWLAPFLSRSIGAGALAYYTNLYGAQGQLQSYIQWYQANYAKISITYDKSDCSNDPLSILYHNALVANFILNPASTSSYSLTSQINALFTLFTNIKTEVNLQTLQSVTAQNLDDYLNNAYQVFATMFNAQNSVSTYLNQINSTLTNLSGYQLSAANTGAYLVGQNNSLMDYYLSLEPGLISYGGNYSTFQNALIQGLTDLISNADSLITIADQGLASTQYNLSIQKRISEQKAAQQDFVAALDTIAAVLSFGSDIGKLYSDYSNNTKFIADCLNAANHGTKDYLQGASMSGTLPDSNTFFSQENTNPITGEKEFNNLADLVNLGQAWLSSTDSNNNVTQGMVNVFQPTINANLKSAQDKYLSDIKDFALDLSNATKENKTTLWSANSLATGSFSDNTAQSLIAALNAEISIANKGFSFQDFYSKNQSLGVGACAANFSSLTVDVITKGYASTSASGTIIELFSPAALQINGYLAVEWDAKITVSNAHASSAANYTTTLSLIGANLA